jgi:hypothetical protein
LAFLYIKLQKKCQNYSSGILYVKTGKNAKTDILAIDAVQIQNNLGFGIWHLNLGFGT